MNSFNQYYFRALFMNCRQMIQKQEMGPNHLNVKYQERSNKVLLECNQGYISKIKSRGLGSKLSSWFNFDFSVLALSLPSQIDSCDSSRTLIFVCCPQLLMHVTSAASAKPLQCTGTKNRRLIHHNYEQPSSRCQWNGWLYVEC